jgi:hypothetical protein
MWHPQAMPGDAASLDPLPNGMSHRYVTSQECNCTYFEPLSEPTPAPFCG